MRRNLQAAIVAAFFVSACASGPRVDPCTVDAEGICSEAKTFRRYRACVPEMIGGRPLIQTGWVVGETWEIGADRQVKVYLFVGDHNPDDGRHIERVYRIKRPCDVAGGREFDVERRDP